MDYNAFLYLQIKGSAVITHALSEIKELQNTVLCINKMVLNVVTSLYNVHTQGICFLCLLNCLTIISQQIQSDTINIKV